MFGMGTGVAPPPLSPKPAGYPRPGTQTDPADGGQCAHTCARCVREIVGAFTSPLDALESSADLKPDAAFLDLSMPHIEVNYPRGNCRKAQAQGINPIDERTWTVAGMAAYACYVTYALILAGIILLGSIWGPEILVNPYNLLGFCLMGIVLLYIGFYYYNLIILHLQYYAITHIL